MKKYNIIVSIILIFALYTASAGNTQETGYSKQTLAVTTGTGFFQNVQINLMDYQSRVIATSEAFMPATIKASYHYYFTPHVALRFSSGYGFARQTKENEMDFSKIDSTNSIISNQTTFSMSGFPIETAVIFEAGINDKISFHLGLGGGYYSYVFTSKGKIINESWEYSQSSGIKISNNETEYTSPNETLYGWAQFFVFGMNIDLTNHIGASLELSKMGMNYLFLEKDVIKPVVDSDNEVEYKIRYGYHKQRYTHQSGFDEMIWSVGLFWKL